MMPKDKLRQLTGKERLGMNRDSEYLGAEDIAEGSAPVLTISGLWNGMVTLQRGKENKDVLTFKEEKVPGMSQVRPLIVNATNRKILKKLYKSVTAEALTGKKVQLYVDHNVRDPQDGGITDGVRIKQIIPPAEKNERGAPKCADCSAEITATEKMTAQQLIAFGQKRYGKALCPKCLKKLMDAEKPVGETLTEETARYHRETAISESAAPTDNHASDCATHNEPAEPNGACDCGAESGESEFEKLMRENRC